MLAVGNAYRIIWFFFCQDEPVDRLMHLCKYVHEQKLPPRMNESSFENELKCSIMNVVNARSEVLMQFLHYILDKLIHLMIRSPVIGGVTGMYVVSSFHISYELLALFTAC